MKKIYFFIFLFSYFFSFSQERRLLRDGNKSYKNEQFDLSLEKYKEALNFKDNFSIAKFNASNALYYKAKNFDSIKNSEQNLDTLLNLEAINLLNDIIQGDHNAEIFADSYYNKSLHQLNMYNESLDINQKKNI